MLRQGGNKSLPYLKILKHMILTSQQAKELLHQQLINWELAKNNYLALQSVRTKDLDFEGFSIRVQFNPARIQSSAAKVDAKSIQERPCFLCPANLPAVQKGIDYENKYQVLVNPFPIFPQHFTIPTYEHTDQLILNRYEDMLDLAKVLDEYTIFYNGPRCGASAPDHAHFQAGNKGFLPIEKDVETVSKNIVSEQNGLKVFTINNYLRNGFFIEATNKNLAVQFFRRLYFLLDIPDGEKEPMMNIISWFANNRWYSCVIPRAKHRPDCFYAEGDENILLSPASVDMGGVFITPLEKDFDKITSEDIRAILKEVCITDDKLEEIVTKIQTL